jgi:hypothetical protein
MSKITFSAIYKIIIHKQTNKPTKQTSGQNINKQVSLFTVFNLPTDS